MDLQDFKPLKLSDPAALWGFYRFLVQFESVNKVFKENMIHFQSVLRIAWLLSWSKTVNQLSHLAPFVCVCVYARHVNFSCFALAS